MAESSYLWSSPAGAGDGSASYTRADWAVIGKILSACHAFEGVGPGFLNALAPSSTGANNARIASGGALVDGKPYQSTANVDVTIISAVGGGNTRIDRVVLRADWTAQTVRVFRIAGTDAGSPTAPAITQTPGSVYDIKLCQVLVNTVGTIVITDERVFAQLSSLNSIANLLITAAHIAAGTITTAKIGALQITSALLAANSVIAGKLADGAIDTAARFAANIVDTGQMALNAVDDTIVGNRVPQFYRRQGGSATDWSLTGTATQTPTTVRMQAGVGTLDPSIGLLTITFPQAFSNKPIFLVTASGVAGTGVYNIAVSATQAVLGGPPSAVVNWLAIGPE